MSKVGIFWDPRGFQLDSLGTTNFLSATDGDTPSVSMSIRMLSIDTPELHYPGTTKPSKQDDNFALLASWIRQGRAPLDDGLAEYLHPKLATGKAGTLQETQGRMAHEAFKAMIERKLHEGGRKRSVYLYAAQAPFDKYGRLLAYMAPNYSAEERMKMSVLDRATFNLLMVMEGWAASFPIYPSLPKQSDLTLLQESGKNAFESGKGIWSDPLTLTGYEFRMCVRLFDITNTLIQGKPVTSAERSSWIDRFCVDMTTREIFYPQDYHRVKPYDRIFIWPEEVTEAVGRLNLVPG